MSKELKDRWFWAYPTESVDCDGITGSAHEVYGKSDVDAVLAENDAEIAQLQAMLEERNKQVGELTENECRLKRALWYMRGCFCGRSSEYFSGMASRCKIGQEDFYKEVSERARRYLKASNKCGAMVQKFGEMK